MKSRLFLLLFLISVSCFALENAEISFIPPEYYVGDVVELRVDIPVAPGTFIQIPKELPRPAWVIIRDISLLESEDSVSIILLFSAFQPGIRVLPAIDLGGIVLEGIKIDTSSILNQTYSSFLPAEDPMYLPRTGFYFALVIGCCLGIPLLLLLFFRGFRRYIKRALVAARRKRPLSRLVKVLRDLERRILNRDGNVYYTTLLHELKLYLAARTGEDFTSLTSREVCEVLERLYPEEYFRGTLEGLFLFSDKVKFGGLDPYTARKKEDLNRVEEAVKSLELYYKHLWAAEDKRGEQNVDS